MNAPKHQEHTSISHRQEGSRSCGGSVDTSQDGINREGEGAACVPPIFAIEVKPQDLPACPLCGGPSVRHVDNAELICCAWCSAQADEVDWRRRSPGTTDPQRSPRKLWQAIDDLQLAQDHMRTEHGLGYACDLVRQVEESLLEQAQGGGRDVTAAGASGGAEEYAVEEEDGSTQPGKR